MLCVQAKQKVVGSVFRAVSLAIVAGLSWGVALPAHAAGAMGFVENWSPTAQIERAAAAAQRASQVTQGAENYVVQLEQLYTMQENLRSDPLQTLTDSATPVGTLLQNYQNLAYNTSALQSDLQNQNQAFGGAYSSYTLSNLSPATFIAQEKAAAEGSNNISANEVQTAVNTMKATNAQWNGVKGAAAKIQMTKGMQANFQLLQEQMNTETEQNQQLITEINTINMHNAAQDQTGANSQKIGASNAGIANDAFNNQSASIQHTFGGVQ